MAHAIKSYDRDNLQAGIIAPSLYPYDVTGQALVANTAYGARFVPSRAMTVDRCGFVVVTSAACNVDVGIYSSGGSRLIRNGGTALPGFPLAGAQVVTFTATALTAGTEYFAAIATDGTPTIMSASWPNSQGGLLFGSSAEASTADATGTNYPLPTSLTGGLSTLFVPILAVRES